MLDRAHNNIVWLEVYTVLQGFKKKFFFTYLLLYLLLLFTFYFTFFCCKYDIITDSTRSVLVARFETLLHIHYGGIQYWAVSDL